MSKSPGYNYTRCRTLGHSWDQIEDDTRVRPLFGVAIQFRCIHCYTIRREIVSPATGELIYRSYKKPPGYAMKDAPSRQEWRVIYLRENKLTTKRRAKNVRSQTSKAVG